MYIQNATYKTIPTEGLTFPLEAGTVLTVNNITGIVPENVAVAAPTGVLYLAVGGTIDLTSEANAGITFTDAELNDLSGDFNFIPLAESGGSSLPSFTSADKGKVLTIKKADPVPVETVIVPTQQVNVPRGGTATLINVIYPFPELEEGQEATVIVTYETTDSWTLVYREIDGTTGFFDEGRNRFLIYLNNSAWQFDPGTEGFYTVFLKADVPTQPMVPKVVIPQVTVTLEANSYFGMDFWAATFPEDANIDTAFFESAEVGDKATFVLDGEAYESTAVNYLSNMVLFPIGEIYVVGYASIFGGIGLAAMSEPAEMTHTISGTKEVDKYESVWKKNILVVDANLDVSPITISSDYSEILAAYEDGAEIFVNVESQLYKMFYSPETESFKVDDVQHFLGQYMRFGELTIGPSGVTILFAWQVTRTEIL